VKGKPVQEDLAVDDATRAAAPSFYIAALLAPSRGAFGLRSTPGSHAVLAAKRLAPFDEPAPPLLGIDVAALTLEPCGPVPFEEEDESPFVVHRSSQPANPDTRMGATLLVREGVLAGSGVCGYRDPSSVALDSESTVQVHEHEPDQLECPSLGCA
jgi:hypothetical protein